MELANNQQVLAYGATKCGKMDFDGHFVNFQSMTSQTNVAEIIYEGNVYLIHIRQLEKIRLLYPNEIYVRDSSLDDVNKDECAICEVPKNSNVANYYARQGSHWVKYIIDPEHLHLSNEEDYELGEEKGILAGNVIFSIEKLKNILKANNVDEATIQKIIDSI